MLTLYIDDSGKPDQSPVQVLAGYLSTAEKWAAFSNEWQGLLDEAGLDAFRMTEAWRMARQYWKNHGSLGRDHLIVRLVECIKRHAEFAFVSSVPFEGFHHYLDMMHDSSHPLGRPYFVNFYILLTQVYRYAFDRHANERVDIVFDEQGGEPATFILSGMDEFRSLASRHFADLVIPTPIFQSDKEVLPLQAADLLAWLVRRDAVNAARRVDRSQRLENLILGEALSMPSIVIAWDEKRLAGTSAILRGKLQTELDKLIAQRAVPLVG